MSPKTKGLDKACRGRSRCCCSAHLNCPSREPDAAVLRQAHARRRLWYRSSKRLLWRPSNGPVEQAVHDSLPWITSVNPAPVSPWSTSI
eukprot:scaffold224623_cov35-Tisochrysis_lutea.AAC.2